MAHVNGQIFGIWTFSVIRRGVSSLDETTSEPTLGWRRSRLAFESSGKSYRNVTKFSFSPLLTLTDWQSNKPSVRLCASIRESVCECVCVVVHVCPHTYTNCGVSYIRGTLTPFFCVKSKERKIKSDFYFNNNLASSFNPRPKTPLKKQNKKNHREKHHVSRPTWPTKTRTELSRISWNLEHFPTEPVHDGTDRITVCASFVLQQPQFRFSRKSIFMKHRRSIVTWIYFSVLLREREKTDVESDVTECVKWKCLIEKGLSGLKKYPLTHQNFT